MYVSLHSPASAAAYASCRVTLPWARSALRLMAFAAFSGSATGRAFTCAALGAEILIEAGGTHYSRRRPLPRYRNERRRRVPLETRSPRTGVYCRRRAGGTRKAELMTALPRAMPLETCIRRDGSVPLSPQPDMARRRDPRECAYRRRYARSRSTQPVRVALCDRPMDVETACTKSTQPPSEPLWAVPQTENGGAQLRRFLKRII